MVNTSNIVSKFAKNGESQVGWPWRLMLFSLLLVGFVVAAYFGLILGYFTYANSAIRDLDSRIAQISASVDPETRSRFLDFYSQIYGIQKILNSHIKTSRIFAMLDANTNPRVRYTIARIDTARLQADINGAAANYQVLSQQLAAFAAASDIANVELRDSQVSESGAVNFFLRLTLKPSLLK